MFSKKHDSSHSKKKGFGIFGIFRIILSLIILGVLFLGIYQAYKSFAGIDPLQTNPKAIINNFISSDAAYKLVTGLLSFSPKTSIEGAKNLVKQDKQIINKDNNNSPILFKFAVIADSENDNSSLEKALKQAKNSQIQFVIGLGDYTTVGTIGELQNTKSVFDRSNLIYYLIPGEHDLWDSRNQGLAPVTNFSQLFGSPYSAFTYQNTRFILNNNSDVYLGLDSAQMSWLEKELESDQGKNTLVFLSTPVYHPSSDHFMGKNDPKVKDQANHLIDLFNKAGVKEIIAGNTHFFSQYSESRTNLKMTTVGATTADRNAQSARFAIVEIHEDGSHNIIDTEISP